MEQTPFSSVFASLTNANKQVFEKWVKFDMRSSINPQNDKFLTKVFCSSGPNVVVLAWTDDGLSCEQALNRVNFEFEVRFDLEGQGQSHPKQ